MTTRCHVGPRYSNSIARRVKLERLLGLVDRPCLIGCSPDTRQSLVAIGERILGSSSMRKPLTRTDQNSRDGLQTVSFQIANGNARHDCILQTTFQTKAQAQKYLLANWPAIERMARDALAAGAVEDGQIKLTII